MGLKLFIELVPLGWQFGLGFYHHTEEDHQTGIYEDPHIEPHDIREVIFYLGKFMIGLAWTSGDEIME